MKFLLLLKLELKTSFKKIPKVIIGAITLIFLIGVIAFCCNKYLYGTDIDKKISIALTIEDDSNMMKVITNLAMESDIANEYINFDICDRDTMYQNIKDGKDIAGILLKENTASDIMNSVNTPIEIIFPKNSGLEAALVKEVADAIGRLLQTAEAGVYASVDFYKEAENYSEKSDMIDRLNVTYLSMVFFRNSAFKSNVLNATGDISVLHYFICSGIVLFLMLFSINIANVYSYFTPHFTYKLICENVSITKQMLIKYATILVQYLTFFIVLIPISFVFIEPAFVLKLLVPILVSILCISSLTLLIYELFTNKNTCIMFLFISSVILAFISGCIIPTLMLPVYIKTTAKAFPIRYILETLTTTFENTMNINNIFILLIFTLLYFSLAVILKKVKTNKSLKGGLQ